MAFSLTEDQLLALLRKDFIIWKWREDLDDRGVEHPFNNPEAEEPDPLSVVLEIIGYPTHFPDGREFNLDWLEQRWFDVVANEPSFPEEEARRFLRGAIDELPAILAEFGFPASDPGHAAAPTEDYF